MLDLSRIIAAFVPVWTALGVLALLRTVDTTHPDLDDREYEEELDTDPELVVIGNSLTAAGVSEVLLEEELGIDVAIVTVPGSEGPAWYALVDNLILQHDPPPRAVVIVNRLDAVLSTHVASVQDQLRLESLLDGDDPVLDRKVLHRGEHTTRWSQLMDRRDRVARTLLDHLRDGVGSVAGFTGADIELAQDAVFDGKVDFGRYDAEALVIPKAAAVDVSESLLPDLLDLARNSGTDIVVARIPTAPTAPDGVDIATVRDVVSLVNEQGGGFVHLPDPPPPPAWFQDDLHLDDRGKAWFTRHLAAAIAPVAKGQAMAAATLPSKPPRIVRVGEPPAPVALGELLPEEGRCTLLGGNEPFEELLGTKRFHDLRSAGAQPLRLLGLPAASPFVVRGDGEPLRVLDNPAKVAKACEPGTYALAHRGAFVVPADDRPLEVAFNDAVTVADGSKGGIAWVYPGTRLELESQEPWTGDDLGIRVLAHTFGPGRPSVTFPGGRTREMDRFGGVWAAEVEALAHDGKWKLVIESPKRGPLVAIHSVVLSDGTHLLDSGRNARTLSVDMMAQPREVTYAHDPPPVPDHAEPVFRGRLGSIRSKAFMPLSDRATGRCSPLVVLEDGEPLERHVRCEQVPDEPGSQCHRAGELRFRPRASRPALHTYEVVYDRTMHRGCDDEVWALPGDALTIELPAVATHRFLQGARRIALGGLVARVVKPGRTGRVDLLLVDEQGELWRDTIAIEALEQGIEAVLDRPLAAGASGVKLHIRNHSRTTAVLFRRATLLEDLAVPGRTAIGRLPEAEP